PTHNPPPADLATPPRPGLGRAVWSRAGAYLALTRPKQWTKNLFVLSPLVFSGRWADGVSVGLGVLAALAFVLVSGAVYCLNDSLDAAADRNHPRKRTRPVASGRVGVSEARVFGAALALAGLGLALALGPAVAGIVVLYLILNGGYSLGWKHRPLVDVMLIAAGFVLRVVGGCVAIGVVPSPWLLVCTAFLALFIALIKRRHELSRSADPNAQRKVMALYSVPLLDQLITGMLPTVVLTYLLYAEHVHSPAFMLTALFVVYGLFRYLYLAHLLDRADRPEDALFADPPLLIAVVLWGISCLLLMALDPR
ncbi:MAG TPA: UbiA prenyltransferase family protein, partial [Gemmataceae bacterium]|nr:UbiA prenyltransferase family protein [Gemmataceae bacterium]